MESSKKKQRGSASTSFLDVTGQLPKLPKTMANSSSKVNNDDYSFKRSNDNTLLDASSESSFLDQRDVSISSDQQKAIPTGQMNGDVREMEYNRVMKNTIDAVFAQMRFQVQETEMTIAEGEQEIIAKEERGFLLKQNVTELKNLQAAHVSAMGSLRENLAKAIEARRERKAAKKMARKSIRSSKKRDIIIQEKKKAADALALVQQAITEKRAAFDAKTQHMYSIHEKQRKNLLQSQERKYQNEKLFVDLECRHMKEEVKSAIMKKFQVRQNHVAVLSKHINDNLRELQLLELRHAKDLFELELISFEELGNKQINFDSQYNDLKLRHMTEMHNAKELWLSEKEAQKEMTLKSNHERQLKDLEKEQRIETRQLKIKHAEKFGAHYSDSKPGSKGGSKAGSIAGSKAGSAYGSVVHSRQGSNCSLNQVEGGNIQSGVQLLVLDDQLEEELETTLDTSGKVVDNSLKALSKRHAEQLSNMESMIKKELADSSLSFEIKLQDMKESQENACRELHEKHERELQDLEKAQEKEILGESMIHDAEMRTLVERRVLQNLFESVEDGIICITVQGIIQRFNHSAENIFGYSADEVIGQSIEMLMPERYSVNHKTYMSNYLTTGIKKVIGTNRTVVGKRKDGQEFPLSLALSEVIEDGAHLFTGIARDLTTEVETKARHERAEEEKRKELELLCSSLDAAKVQSDNLLKAMLPPSVSQQLMMGKKVAPQSFKCATIFFLDVVGFTTLSSQIPPLEVVTFLNELYSTIDTVLDLYDVYKVETIGDSYMIVSGLPEENAHHASEIATMALHLGYAVENYVYSANQSLKIRIRMGINTGSVVAGCVGTKMARYCLFGDTVNTASRMESNSAPGKIHISESTYNELVKDGTFLISNRGEIDVKGKGKMNTYWVDGKKGFDPSKIKVSMTKEESILSTSLQLPSNESMDQ